MDRLKIEIILIVILGTISVTVFLKQWKNIKEEVGITSIFQVGDCVRLPHDSDDEFNLDEPAIMQIVQIGKIAYKYGFLNRGQNPCIETDSRCYSFPIRNQLHYEKTSCNAK